VLPSAAKEPRETSTSVESAPSASSTKKARSRERSQRQLTEFGG